MDRRDRTWKTFLSRDTRIHTGIVAGYNRAFNRTRHCPEISGKVNDERGGRGGGKKGDAFDQNSTRCAVL